MRYFCQYEYRYILTFIHHRTKLQLQNWIININQLDYATLIVNQLKEQIYVNRTIQLNWLCGRLTCGYV